MFIRIGDKLINLALIVEISYWKTGQELRLKYDLALAKTDTVIIGDEAKLHWERINKFLEFTFMRNLQE